MKSYFNIFILIGTILCWTHFSYSQPGRGLNQNEITRLYNPANEVTLEGQISKVILNNSGYGRFPVTLVDLKTKEKAITVYIAPDWYVTAQKIELKSEQNLLVTGSVVKYNQQDLMIARIIKYNSKEMTLRDSKGIPVWAGSGPRSGRGRGQGRR
ncbi:hypothetical protein JW964_00420 [candidate division KSB1 bacterium]|nr:hypothetical protein [candidate division KSB1 bacterium]